VGRALAHWGRVVTVEFVPDEGGTPPHVAMFSLVMLCTDPGGATAYTFAELARHVPPRRIPAQCVAARCRPGRPQVIISQR